jgi:putative Holliday junction resolvase
VRAIGLDLGTRRIGVAVSDSGGTLASPYEVVERGADRASDHATIARIVADLDAELVVVGLPLSLDGTIGPAAAAALAEVDELAAALDVPVETHDERLTTVTAEASLRDQGVKGRARRRVVDKVAATVMLQAWLDGRRVQG